MIIPFVLLSIATVRASSSTSASVDLLALIDSGDTAWVLASSALIFLMTLGVGYFYAGLVKAKDRDRTLALVLVCVPIVAVQWFFFGYSFAYGNGGPFFGNCDFCALRMDPRPPNTDYAATIPHAAFVMFQLTFATITPSLIAGAIVGRVKFVSWCVFVFLWSTLIYDLIAHWVWAIGSEGDGFIRALPFFDFAGGLVVHICSGFSGLACSLFLRFRLRQQADVADAQAFHRPYLLLGTGLLSFGWFGFNGGSALVSGSIASLAFLNTGLAGATGALAWNLWELVRVHEPSLVGASVGCVVGLVAVTPSAGFVYNWAAIVIGFVGASVVYGITYLKTIREFDDPLDSFTVHGIGGIAGSIMTGLFSNKNLNELGADGAFYSNGVELGYAIAGILIVMSISFFGSLLIVVALEFTIGFSMEQDLDSSDSSSSSGSDEEAPSKIPLAKPSIPKGKAAGKPAAKPVIRLPETHTRAAPHHSASASGTAPASSSSSASSSDEKPKQKPETKRRAPESSSSDPSFS